MVPPDVELRITRAIDDGPQGFEIGTERRLIDRVVRGRVGKRDVAEAGEDVEDEIRNQLGSGGHAFRQDLEEAPCVGGQDADPNPASSFGDRLFDRRDRVGSEDRSGFGSQLGRPARIAERLDELLRPPQRRDESR